MRSTRTGTSAHHLKPPSSGRGESASELTLVTEGSRRGQDIRLLLQRRDGETKFLSLVSFIFLSLLPGFEFGETGAPDSLLLQHVGGGGGGGGKNGAEGRGVGQEEEDAASLSRALCAALMMHGETRAEPR